MRKGMRKILMIFILAIFTFSIGCGKEKLPEVSKGYIWEASKDGKTINLVGTIHIATDGVDYMNDTLKKITDESDVLAVEANMINARNDKSQDPTANLYENGKTVEDELASEYVEKLKGIMEEYKIGYFGVSRHKPPYIVTVLQAISINENKIKYHGLDAQLMNKFNNSKKEIVELEGIKYQEDIINDLIDIEYLKTALDKFDVKKQGEDYISAIKDFSLGEEPSGESVKEQYKNNTREYEVMIKNRNIGMVNKIDEYIKEDKKYTVAVGCNHFFGDDGIVKLLEDRGYEVKKVDVK